MVGPGRIFALAAVKGGAVMANHQIITFAAVYDRMTVAGIELVVTTASVQIALFLGAPGTCI